jgi:hypothetical protein
MNMIGPAPCPLVRAACHLPMCGESATPPKSKPKSLYEARDSRDSPPQSGPLDGSESARRPSSRPKYGNRRRCTQSRCRWSGATVISEHPTAEAAFVELGRLTERLRRFNIPTDQFQWVVVDAGRRPGSRTLNVVGGLEWNARIAIAPASGYAMATFSPPDPARARASSA